MTTQEQRDRMAERDKKNEAILQHLAVQEMREQRHALAANAMVWMREISELQRTNHEDGIRLGMSPTAEWMKRQVERRSKVERLKVDLADAQEKLADLDAKLRQVDGDVAEKSVREAIAALQKSGAPGDWVKLRDGLFALRHAGRIGQSADAIRKKIERLSQPGMPQAVRVRNERVTDFLLWLPKVKEEAAA